MLPVERKAFSHTFLQCAEPSLVQVGDGTITVLGDTYRVYDVKRDEQTGEPMIWFGERDVDE